MYAGNSTDRSLGAFGERKLSGYTTSTALKNPSKAQSAAMRLLAPLKLAKEASARHREIEIAEAEGVSPASPKKGANLMVQDQDNPDYNPFMSQKQFI